LILYPKAYSSKQNQNARFLQPSNFLLKGLDNIEKAIVIKDQKMFKRKDRKEYYGLYFYAIVLIFSGIPYISRINEDSDFLSFLMLSMIFSGVAFSLFMIETSLLSKYISYTSEGQLVLTYHRLSITVKQIFNAKLRIFLYMLLPVVIIYFGSLAMLFVQFSFDKLWLFLFNTLYFLGLARFKLRNFIHLDTQNKDAFKSGYQTDSSGMGVSVIMGLFFIILVPLGYMLLANQVLIAFGIHFVYMMMITLILLIWIMNIVYDIKIYKKHKEVSYD